MTNLSRIRQIAIVAQDVARAAAFYRDALGMKVLFEMDGLAFFDAGGVRLMLSRASAPEHDHLSSILYFDAADIHAAHGDLVARGVQFVEEPHIVGKLPHADVWTAAFKDSEGNLLALQSEVPRT